MSNKKEDRNERMYVIWSISYMVLEQTGLIMVLEIRIMLTTILSGIDWDRGCLGDSISKSDENVILL